MSDDLATLVAVCEKAAQSKFPVTIDPAAVLPVVREAATALTEARAEIVSLRAELGETHLVLEQTEKSAAREIERLQRDCAEAYKVVDTLAGAHVDLFNDHQVIKALDNLSAAVDFINPRPHDDLLPFAPVLADDPIAALESELSTLRARVREVVGQMVDLTEDFKVYGPAVVAARQLMEEVK